MAATMIIMGYDSKTRLNLDVDALEKDPSNFLTTFGTCSENCAKTARVLVGASIDPARGGALEVISVRDTALKPAELYVFSFPDTPRAEAFLNRGVIDKSLLINKVIYIID